MNEYSVARIGQLAQENQQLRSQLAAEREYGSAVTGASISAEDEIRQLRSQLAAERERYDDLQRSVMDLSHPNCKGLLDERNDARQQLAVAVEALKRIRATNDIRHADAALEKVSKSNAK